MKIESFTIISALLSGISDGSRILSDDWQVACIIVALAAKNLAERNHDKLLSSADAATASFIGEITKIPKNISMLDMLSE